MTYFQYCSVCDGLIGWITCPTGGWWAHEVHPPDGQEHDATPRDQIGLEDEAP